MCRKRHTAAQIIGKLREAETELAIAEAHPGPKRGAMFELVQEWLMQEDEAVH